jgi:putative NADH-flavin reductase
MHSLVLKKENLMKLIVFGSTGGIGRNIVEQALRAGHHVTAIARNPSALTIEHANLEIVKGDVFQPATFDKVMKEQSAVLSAIGISSTKQTTVYSEGVSNIVKAMQKNGVQRIICVSASAVVTSPRLSFPIRMMTKLLQKILKNMYSDLLKMEQVVKQTNLEWTVVRPPKLTKKPVTGKYRFAVNEWLSSCLSISRADVAHFMLQHIDDTDTYRSIIEVAN